MKNVTKACAIVAVKGGVGKTMAAINIARRLADKYSQKVGLVDADFDNSNFSQFTNVNAELQIIDGKEFKLYDWKGIQVFSMSLIAGREKSVSMTGDRYGQMLDDALRIADWNVDILIIDLPGGSSDIFTSVMQLFGDNIIGNIVITQPSMTDALHRILNLHKYFQIPTLGVIENMAYFECPDCEKAYYPFGIGKTNKISKKFNTELIGKIPISSEIADRMIEGEAILEGKYLHAIDIACDIIMKAEVVKTGFFEKFKAKIADEVYSLMVKTFSKLMVITNTIDLDFHAIRRETGFTERKIMKLIITDEKMKEELTSVNVRLLDTGLKYIKNPKKVDFEIVTSFSTLARSILRKRKVNGKIEEFDAMDAFLNGEIKAYGEGHSAKAIQAFREIFLNDEIMENMGGRTKKVLERFI